jgi:hypothetical protein
LTLLQAQGYSPDTEKRFEKKKAYLTALAKGGKAKARMINSGESGEEYNID